MLAKRYCYWSVASGVYAENMEACAQSARRVGVREEFHVFAERAIVGCICHEAYTVQSEAGIFKLIYLKAAVTTLEFDYYVWIDSDSLFQRRPACLLANLSRSPLHVPLFRLNGKPDSAVWPGVSQRDYVDLMRDLGVKGYVYRGTSAFWIVSSKAVEAVFNLSMGFWHSGKRRGLTFPVDAALTYAMQMLCGNSRQHEIAALPAYWAPASCDGGEGNLELSQLAAIRHLGRGGAVKA